MQKKTFSKHKPNNNINTIVVLVVVVVNSIYVMYIIFTIPIQNNAFNPASKKWSLCNRMKKSKKICVNKKGIRTYTEDCLDKIIGVYIIYI